MNKAFLIILILSLTSCASRPQLYPNAKLKKVGKKAAKKDIEKCITDADEYLESSKGKNVAKSAGVGAAIGAGGGAAAGALSPDEIKHRYVNQCLADQGYRVLGWD
jgi:outer membrane lipoprotein SlyB